MGREYVPGIETTAGPRRTRLLVGAAAVLLLAGCSGTPAPTATTPTPSAQPAIYLPECIAADDGIPTRVTTATGFSDGVVMGQGARGVVISHQTDDGPCDYIDFARDLVRRGYHVALYSQTDPSAELPAWIDRLQTSGASRIVLFGASIGAMTAIQVAQDHAPPVTGVVSLSAYSGLDGSDYVDTAAAGLRLPALYVASKDDPDTAAAAANFVKLSPTRNKTLLVVPGFEHGMSITRAGSGAEVQAAVMKFLAAQT